MPDPVITPLIVAAALTAATVSAYGAYQQGQAAKAEGDYQAAVSRNNAIIAEQNAKASREAGEIEAREARRRTAQVAGQQEGRIAAGNIELGTGTAADVLESTYTFGELDVQTILYNSKINERNLKLEANNLQSQAGLFEFQGRSRRLGANIQAGATLLGGVASAGYQGYTLHNMQD